MPSLLLVVSGGLFCALTAFFADDAGWVEVAANGFLPYVTVPLAVGLLATGASRAALQGGASTVVLVLAFYAVNALVSPYALSMSGPVFWALAGGVTGAVLGVSAWWTRPRVAGWRRIGVWALPAAAQAYALGGPSVYSGAEVAAGWVLLAGFSGALIVIAEPRKAGRQGPLPPISGTKATRS